MNAPGPLALVGGGEHRSGCEPIDRRLMDEVGVSRPRVAVVPVASTRRQLPLVQRRDLGAKVTAAGPRSVRISVTDRCDYACGYCRPSRSDGYLDGRLDLAAWATLVDGLIAAGVHRFRLTGGEPLLVPHVVDLVRLIADRGVRDLALTTNASQLAELAAPLRAAGLMRINVSIDTLDEARFSRLTRGGKLADVLAGIDAARAAGLGPIKLNTVVLRGENEGERYVRVDNRSAYGDQDGREAEQPGARRCRTIVQW